MVNLSKQDVQSVVENAKNQMLQRVVTRQDFQTLIDQVRTLTTIVQQNQQIIRQSEYQRVQMMRHMAALEGRIIQMDQEIRQLRGVIDRLAEKQPERVLMPVQADGTPAPAQGYQFNPV